jgi:cell division septation protein DedD
MASDQGPREPRPEAGRPDAGPEDPAADDLGPVHEQRPASDYYDDDPYDDYDDGPRLLARRLVQGGVALLAVAIFLGVVWYAYSWGTRTTDGGSVPVVEAPEGAEKVKPEDPGGMDVPHQDKLVMNERAEGEGEKVERLLPPPEEPQPPEGRKTEQADPGAPAENGGADASAGDGGTAGSGDGQEVAERPETTVPGQDPEAGASGDGSAAGDAQPLAEEPEAGPDTAAGDDTETAETAETGQTPETAETQSGGQRTPGTKPGGDGGSTGNTQTAAAAPTEQALEEPADAADAPAEGRYAVQLAAFGSEQAARNAWSTYQSKFSDLLGGRQLLLQRAEVDGKTYWRVRTGPFGERSAAQQLCQRLKAQDQGCLPVTR